MELNADGETIRVHNLLKSEIKNEKKDWEDVYRDLANSKSFKGYSTDNLSETPTERFQNFTMRDVFEIFELSSQVNTKIKIYLWEKEILILAGRYAVWLKNGDISALLI